MSLLLSLPNLTNELVSTKTRNIHSLTNRTNAIVVPRILSSRAISPFEKKVPVVIATATSEQSSSRIENIRRPRTAFASDADHKLPSKSYEDYLAKPLTPSESASSPTFRSLYEVIHHFSKEDIPVKEDASTSTSSSSQDETITKATPAGKNDTTTSSSITEKTVEEGEGFSSTASYPAETVTLVQRDKEPLKAVPSEQDNSRLRYVSEPRVPVLVPVRKYRTPVSAPSTGGAGDTLSESPSYVSSDVYTIETSTRYRPRKMHSNSIFYQKALSYLKQYKKALAQNRPYGPTYRPNTESDNPNHVVAAYGEVPPVMYKSQAPGDADPNPSSMIGGGSYGGENKESSYLTSMYDGSGASTDDGSSSSSSSEDTGYGDSEREAGGPLYTVASGAGGTTSGSEGNDNPASAGYGGQSEPNAAGYTATENSKGPLEEGIVLPSSLEALTPADALPIQDDDKRIVGFIPVITIPRKSLLKQAGDSGDEGYSQPQSPAYTPPAAQDPPSTPYRQPSDNRYQQPTPQPDYQPPPPPPPPPARQRRPSYVSPSVRARTRTYGSNFATASSFLSSQRTRERYIPLLRISFKQ